MTEAAPLTPGQYVELNMPDNRYIGCGTRRLLILDEDGAYVNLFYPPQTARVKMLRHDYDLSLMARVLNHDPKALAKRIKANVSDRTRWGLDTGGRWTKEALALLEK